MPEEKYEVKNEDIEKRLKEMGKLLSAGLPEGWGFMLMIFDFDSAKIPDSQRAMFYLSNAQRLDMIKAIEEFLAKQKTEK